MDVMLYLAILAVLIAAMQWALDFWRHRQEAPDIDVETRAPDDYPPTITGEQGASMFGIQQDVIFMNKGQRRVTIIEGEASFAIGNMKEVGPNLYTYKRELGRHTGFADGTFPLILDGGEARTVALAFTFEASPTETFDADWYREKVNVRLRTTAGTVERTCEFAVTGYSLRLRLRRYFYPRAK